jgi:hypothetical protein
MPVPLRRRCSGGGLARIVRRCVSHNNHSYAAYLAFR